MGTGEETAVAARGSRGRGVTGEPDISSAANPLLKRIRRLRRHRKPDDPAFVEGVVPVTAAVRAGIEIESVVFAPTLLRSEGARRLLDEVGDLGLPTVSLSAEAFASVSDREHPAGVAALVRPRVVPLEQARLGPRAVAIALHEPGGPGNLGSIVRTMDATGCSPLILVGPATDPWSAESVKASMGTVFTVPVTRAASAAELKRWARDGAAAVVATSAHAPASLWRADVSPPCVLYFGSERKGLGQPELEVADATVSLPMAGTASSLNLAVAAGVVMYAVTRSDPATP